MRKLDKVQIAMRRLMDAWQEAKERQQIASNKK